MEGIEFTTVTVLVPRVLCLHTIWRGYLIWSTMKENKLRQTSAVEEAERATCCALEGDFLRLSRVLSWKREKKLIYHRGTALDHCETFELVVADEVYLMNAGNVSVPQWGQRALVMGGDWVLDYCLGGIYMTLCSSCSSMCAVGAILMCSSKQTQAGTCGSLQLKGPPVSHDGYRVSWVVEIEADCRASLFHTSCSCAE